MEPDEQQTVFEMTEERPMLYDPNDYDERQSRALEPDGFTFWAPEPDESEDE